MRGFRFFVIVLALASSSGFAQNCRSNHAGLDFFLTALNKNKSVTCNYRYCYYTCRYSSYPMQGKFQPYKGNWKQTSPHAYECRSKLDGQSYAYSFEQQ